MRSLTLALDGGEWSVSRPGRSAPRERSPGTKWRLGGPQNRSGHGCEEKYPQPPPGFELRSSDRSARGHSVCLTNSMEQISFSETDSHSDGKKKKSPPFMEQRIPSSLDPILNQLT
jgi:hypothetical protein